MFHGKVNVIIGHRIEWLYYFLLIELNALAFRQWSRGIHMQKKTLPRDTYIADIVIFDGCFWNNFGGYDRIFYLILNNIMYTTFKRGRGRKAVLKNVCFRSSFALIIWVSYLFLYARWAKHYTHILYPPVIISTGVVVDSLIVF